MERLKERQNETAKKITIEDLHLAYPETEKRKRPEVRKRVRLAKQRIGQILTNSFAEITETDNLPIEYQVLRLYGFGQKERSETSMIAAHQQAFSLIAEDLLWAELYDRRGSLLGFAEKNYETVNPDEFTVIPLVWQGAEEILQAHLENQGWGDEDDLEGMEIIEMEFEEDYKIDFVAVQFLRMG